MDKCSICRKEFPSNEMYEYRGVFACSEHIDEATRNRDLERSRLIKEEDRKTSVFSGLDLSDSTIGKENRKLLKGHIEIASRESSNMKKYEGRDK